MHLMIQLTMQLTIQLTIQLTKQNSLLIKSIRLRYQYNAFNDIVNNTINNTVDEADQPINKVDITTISI